MKIFSVLKQIEFAAKLFAAVGFNFSAAFEAKNENALKEFVAGVAKEKVEPTEEQLTALVHGELRAVLKLSAEQDPIAHVTSMVATLSTATAQLAAIRAAKIEFAADAKPEAVAAAIASRISTAAGEKLATTGVGTNFPEQTVAADPTKTAAQTIDPKLTGLARAIAANRLQQQNN